MIAKDEDIVVTEVPSETLPLIHVQAGAFEIVIADTAVIPERVDADGEYTAGQGSDGHPGGGVGVDDAMNIRSKHVNGAVDDETGWIDLLGWISNDVCVLIDFHQVRRADFVEPPGIRIDEKVLGSRNAGARMGLDQVAPTKVIYQAVESGEVDAQFALLIRDGISFRGHEKQFICEVDVGQERLLRSDYNETQTMNEQTGRAQTEVPCGTCIECCKSSQALFLHPEQGDDVESYRHRVLLDRATGPSIYLPPPRTMGPAFTLALLDAPYIIVGRSCAVASIAASTT